MNGFVSCSIVTYNNDLKMLSRVFSSLKASSVEIKTHVVDNSTDLSVRDFCKDEKVEYHHMGKNVGFGAGHNYVLSTPEKVGEYHLVLNPDIYFDSDVISSLAGYMDKHQDVAMVIPKIEYPDGSTQHLPKVYPAPYNLFFRFFGRVPFLSPTINDRYTMKDRELNAPFRIGIVSGCFSFLRATLVHEGLRYDERFFMYFEDFDFSRQAGRFGKLVCCPQVSVTHEYHRGSRKSLRLFFIFLHSYILYFNKWGWVIDRDRRAKNRDILEGMM